MLSRALLLGFLSWIFVAMNAGCVTVYQPLVTLQRPVAIDPQLPNFPEDRVLLRCVPSDYIDEDDAQQLCRQVRTALANQGATVETEVPGTDAAPEVKPQWVVRIQSRLLHQENSPLLWVLSVGTFTLIPAITEYTFASDVEIHDASGFLLVADTLQARFVRYFGAGSWVVNKAADWLVRSKEDRVTGDVASEQFSKDYYAQLSQMLLHAKMRAKVLRSFEGEAAK